VQTNAVFAVLVAYLSQKAVINKALIILQIIGSLLLFIACLNNGKKILDAYKFVPFLSDKEFMIKNYVYLGIFILVYLILLIIFIRRVGACHDVFPLAKEKL